MHCYQYRPKPTLKGSTGQHKKDNCDQPRSHEPSQRKIVHQPIPFRLITRINNQQQIEDNLSK
ncbi:hypothetical protein Halhy_4631 [Haliscomenobacter hydrossis DSM 1100]|uniref:Uncharacterized protein n=1 Tax=Haliscomenobacter hydrossis (strain ATCC 27775 / DSM 1100 / LMG 10767 / O) TaxID=760192 RepID=F4KVL0_HALH1|nr:hypothetical protein Halhy_4631 [Haliscomenobacter hydrossis DSM 1100]